MKKILAVFLILILLLYMTACSYHPPEGWTKKHHTYEEVLAFAKLIDPNATVAEEYTDTLDEYEWSSLATISCATSISWQTEQCLPSVSPVSVQVGETASSIASVC